MKQLKPGFYWIKLGPNEDWEPAMWNTDVWVILGAGVSEDEPEEPYEIGQRIEAPE